MASRAPGLVYVSDAEPGIARRRTGSGFTYILPSGKPVKSASLKTRIEELAIPPAWTDVWICRKPNGHIQAIGYDERGRKQYIYHPDWRALRDKGKFARLPDFGAALPRIRRRIRADLALRGLPKEKVLAAIVSLLDKTALRVGNERYTEENGSYGLTTLKTNHAKVQGKTLTLRFRGKGNKQHETELTNDTLAKLVRKLHDLPGQQLFQYRDEAGIRTSITSTDVNNYLQLITGESFTAKDFRTWHASVLAFEKLSKAGKAKSDKEVKAHINDMLEAVAEALGNTPSVCRTSYVHPEIIEQYERKGALPKISDQKPKQYTQLRKPEAHFLVFLSDKSQS